MLCHVLHPLTDFTNACKANQRDLLLSCCQCQDAMRVYQTTRDAYNLMRPVMLFQLDVDQEDNDIDTGFDFHLPAFLSPGLNE